MNAETRLAQLATALDELGLRYLVMGGHAVRFHGVDRNTLDFDLHLSLADFTPLRETLVRAPLFAGAPLEEGSSWRPRDFRRFIIGRLPDGREERLEFWRRNHLLAPFEELFARREEGDYGGRRLPFLSLPDLLRSKETERESDWQDIALLEEIQDERNLACATDAGGQRAALAALRSRVGFDRAAALQLLRPTPLLRAAFAHAAHPVTQTMLFPFHDEPRPTPHLGGLCAEIFAGPLRQTAGGSARHLALVEVVRRSCKQSAMDADRRDKLASQRSQPGLGE